MAIIEKDNSLSYITQFSPIRCDGHFKKNISLSDKFFKNNELTWVSLGSVIDSIQNGMNVSTDYYSMEETDILYISVSQIREYGLIDKNQNFLIEDIRNTKSFFELEPNMLLITRSGTIGTAISTNNQSFDFDINSYVASGFVITSKVNKNYSSDIIANYINLFDVQNYLNAMASGACQKNISQPTILSLPIPEVLLKEPEEFENIFNKYNLSIKSILDNIKKQESKMLELKHDTINKIKEKIFSL